MTWPSHGVSLEQPQLKGTAHFNPAPSWIYTSGSVTAPGRAGWSSASMPTAKQVFEEGDRAPGITQKRFWHDYSLPHVTVCSSIPP